MDGDPEAAQGSNTKVPLLAARPQSGDVQFNQTIFISRADQVGGDVAGLTALNGGGRSFNAAQKYSYTEKQYKEQQATYAKGRLGSISSSRERMMGLSSSPRRRRQAVALEATEAHDVVVVKVPVDKYLVENVVVIVAKRRAGSSTSASGASSTA